MVLLYPFVPPSIGPRPGKIIGTCKMRSRHAQFYCKANYMVCITHAPRRGCTCRLVGLKSRCMGGKVSSGPRGCDVLPLQSIDGLPSVIGSNAFKHT